MAKVPNGVLDAYTHHRNNVLVHDVIWGKTGSGKTAIAQQLADNERKSGLADAWLIDFRTPRPNWDGRVAKNLDEAHALLGGALAHVHAPTRKILTVTMEDAYDVLKDPFCLFLVEQIVKYGHRIGVKVRLVVMQVRLSAFGGSAVILDAVTAGNVIEAGVK